MSAAFDDALATSHCWLQLDGGQRHELPVWRWHAEPDEADELMLHRCQGSTLDVGCGPGRLTRALRERGTVALGIDTSPRAVQLTERRGGIALRQSVFEPVPLEGSWQHVLLADGNVGIGGDPMALLGRVGELLAAGGTAIVEVGPPGTGLRCGHARIGSGPLFPWSVLGADAVASLVTGAGFEPVWDSSHDGRWFVELVRP
ncbi:MAG: methyltransferase domain-containing protein [Pseudonocardiaceae bacterium]|nr:methyltransferase domain-containing protein [Pseudonocardiaceae bacterium]